MLDYSKILEKIKPSQEEEEIVRTISQYVIIYLKKLFREDVEIVAGGSSAKGTFLKGDFDIDIFVRFKNKKENYSNELHKVIKTFCENENLTYERLHGSRDYFQFTFKSISFEIIPVKYVTKIKDIENVTDMSPLHVEWVKSKLSNKLADDIRLAKQFCKGQKIYGAESYINGFSGHVIDILIIYYGGFDKMLKAVSRWEDTTIIDTENSHKDVLKELNKSKLQSPLIIIDPIDSTRNASASLSKENYLKFIECAKEFIKNPKETFFKIPKFSKSMLEKNKKSNELLYVLDIKPLEGKRDVVGSKILKAFEFINKELTKNDFIVNSSGWFFNKEETHMYFYIDDKILEKTYIRIGPKNTNKEAVKSFKDKHPSTFPQEDYICTNIPRKFILPEKFFKYLLEQEQFKSRIESFDLN